MSLVDCPDCLKYCIDTSEFKVSNRCIESSPCCHTCEVNGVSIPLMAPQIRDILDELKIPYSEKSCFGKKRGMRRDGFAPATYAWLLGIANSDESQKVLAQQKQAEERRRAFLLLSPEEQIQHHIDLRAKIRQEMNERLQKHLEKYALIKSKSTIDYD